MLFNTSMTDKEHRRQGISLTEAPKVMYHLTWHPV
uniref:Uncharacterized protein n=1 Tax=Arundo donax TaxID=35708 RepID=A0A0A9AIT8_ARUDO